MPEGDTVYLAAQRLHAALAGKPLRKTDFRVPRLATVDLAGKTVEAVVARGKHLFFQLTGDVRIHTHFKMDGAWHLYRPGEKWRGRPAWQARVVLESSDWTAVGFQLPVLELVDRDGERRVVDTLGPDPLGDSWNADEALRRLTRDGDRTISAALLDQSVMAGPGNVYRCEICFLRGLHPWTSVANIAEPERIVDLTRRLLEANRGRSQRVTTGDPRPGRELWVYGRAGRPCRRCGRPVRRRQGEPTPDGERLTFWCEHCQPPPARAS